MSFLTPRSRHRVLAIAMVVSITAEIVLGFAWVGTADTSARERWWVLGATTLAVLGTLSGGLLLLRMSVRQGRVEAEKLTAVGLERTKRLAEVGQLVAGLAHEVHNPLQGLSGYLALLDRDGLDPEKRKAHIAAARAALVRVERLTRDLLDYANPSAQRPVDVAPYDLFQSVLRLAAADPRFQSATIETRVESGVPSVRVDAAAAERILLNLLLNAREAGGTAGCRIALVARRAGDAVELAVEDDGPGVPSAMVPHLFEPFRSGRGSTGLGLWICANLGRANGGELRYEPIRPRGARFVLSLPTS